ncbi:hypothetical protein FRB95_013010 [Tulasnella sp. JGI-2019a]|nr:hypothetical protein FRB95_013010 [Tulasnella sp. JGI-2019a]
MTPQGVRISLDYLAEHVAVNSTLTTTVPHYQAFKDKKMVTSISMEVDMPADVQDDYDLDYMISDLGLTIGDLELDMCRVYHVQYDDTPSLPGQFINKEANAVYGVLDYRTF